MNEKKLIWAIVIVVLWAVFAIAAPVDHVYVSNELVDKFNLDGSLDMNFLNPGDANMCRLLAVDGTSGNVWLGCDGDLAVALFSSDGTILNFVLVGPVDGQICVDPFGNAWVTDRPTNIVRKFLPDGTYVNSYSTGGSNSGAIACDRLGNVWTANDSSQDVSKLDNNGNILNIYPLPSWAPTIAIDQLDNIWLGGGS